MGMVSYMTKFRPHLSDS